MTLQYFTNSAYSAYINLMRKFIPVSDRNSVDGYKWLCSHDRNVAILGFDTRFNEPEYYIYFNQGRIDYDKQHISYNIFVSII